MTKSVRGRYWGRWGTADEIGAMNFIGPSVILNAVRLVKKGKIYPLALPISSRGVPQFPTRFPPFHSTHIVEFAPSVSIAEDYIFTCTHNQTHIDALAHVWFGNKLYNGFSADNVTSLGARKCSIDKIGPIVTRGVLLDIAAYRGVDHLERGDVIGSKDIIGCMEAEGVKLQKGDALLIRTGWIRTFDSEKPHDFFKGNPGLGRSSISVIEKGKVALVGADNYSVEVDPAESNQSSLRGSRIPVHIELIWKRGIHLIELMDLEALARDKVWEFLFVAIPLRIQGGVGSPIVPVAIV